MAQPSILTNKGTWVRHFQLVSAPAHTSDLSATSVSTSWTAGSGLTDVAAGDTIFIIGVGFGGAAVSTPSGWTLELNSGNEYYVWSKTAVASEPNVTFSGASAEDFSIMAIAARDVSSVEKATVAWLGASWYHGTYGATFQPSVDLTGGASADWAMLTVTVGTSNGDHYVSRVADDSNIFDDDVTGWVFEEFADAWSGGYRMSAVEYVGEWFKGFSANNDVQLKVTTAQYPSSVAQFQIAVQMDSGAMGSADISNLPVTVQHTPGIDGDIANLPIVTAGLAAADVDLANLSLTLAYNPSLDVTSAITMLMENPGLVAQNDSEIVEYRYPDVPSAVRGVMVRAAHGRLTRQWEILVDAGNVLNVDNQPIDPNKVYDDLTLIGAQQLELQFSDFTSSTFKDREDTETVKIQTVEKLAWSNGEHVLRVIVREN